LEDDEDAARGTLPCVEKARCQVEYGTSPLDIARFGVLPHCKNHRQKTRCVAYVSSRDGGRQVDFRLKTYRHSFDSAPATIDDIISGGISPRIYVNENGTLVVDGGRPVVVVPSAPQPPGIPAKFPAAQGQHPATTTPSDEVKSSPKPAREILLSPSPAAREILPVPSPAAREILQHHTTARENLSPPATARENIPPTLPAAREILPLPREHQLENQQQHQVSSAKTLFKLFEALQSITQSLVSSEKARSVQLVAKLDGKQPLFIVNATKGDFLNLLKSVSKFDISLL